MDTQKGLRIMVVDDDVTFLSDVERILTSFDYKVTCCEHPLAALTLLREQKGEFDLVLTDVHMPEMDGVELLQHIRMELDLPVIMMSADPEVTVALKGLEYGACICIMKPISPDQLKNIWQYAFRERRVEKRVIEQTRSVEDTKKKKESEDSGSSYSVNQEINSKEPKRKKDAKGEKPHVTWDSTLHEKFMTAINHLGFDSAVPTTILSEMNVQGLTRQHVASHLQVTFLEYNLMASKVAIP
ncbi:two-component response regulator ARR14-like [Tasmannia lanceolata]|uniref:two-component response regulator ARR14-like n=1 Tax=Tasmannia lanceolata TaxID=3420 RepID=UPI00406425D8